jgi:hypothetical protein
MLVLLSVGVQWNHSYIMAPLPSYLIYPYESKSNNSMAMLSNAGYGRSRVAENRS